MKHNKQLALLGVYLSTLIIALFLCEPDALAAESTKTWRSTFDLVMRWVNFGIIAFLLVKYTKTPIKDFFQKRKNEIDREMKKYEHQKEAVEEKISDVKKMLVDSQMRFEKIKESIIADGENKKQKIIEDARQESMILLATSRQRIENQILEARNLIRSELIESAIALAEKRLPLEITAADQHKLIDNFMESTGGK